MEQDPRDTKAARKKQYPNDGGLKEPAREFQNVAFDDVVKNHFFKNEKFDALVFIGRFQPFHIEHLRVVETALEKSKCVIVLVGSAGSARTIRNPFTFEERANMIYNSIKEQDRHRVFIKPIYDKTYNDAAWVKQVQTVVKDVLLHIANGGKFGINGTADVNVGLIGAQKDHTSYYLKLFPQFGSVNVDISRVMHATAVREGFLEGKYERYQLEGNIVPHSVAEFLFDEFIKSENYIKLQKELAYVVDYKKQWEAAPYPVKHVTVDALVEQSGHVLLVKRKSEPGKGLWALPGGHLNEYEKIEDGVFRELDEETIIKVPPAVLRGSVVAEKVFDSPNRSTLGRVITHAKHIKLKDDIKLPKIKGSDDAEKAKWVPISDIKEDQLFDDHFFIISHFLKI
jgi:bifunctional NMN adenylyltransferase/nudix hydrolase